MSLTVKIALPFSGNLYFSQNLMAKALVNVYSSLFALEVGEEKGRGEGGSSKVHCEDSIVRVKVLAGCPWRVDFVFH